MNKPIIDKLADGCGDYMDAVDNVLSEGRIVLFYALAFPVYAILSVVAVLITPIALAGIVARRLGKTSKDEGQ